MAIGDMGIALAVLAFVFRFGFDSTANLVAVSLIAAGLALFFGLGALEAKKKGET